MVYSTSLRRVHKAFSFFCLLALPLTAGAQSLTTNTYDIGNPTLRELYVDSTHGSDSNNGLSSANALRSVAAAWNLIPQGSALEIGYRINLAPGTYTREQLPNYWEARHGTAAHPIILQASGASGSVTFTGDINAFDVRYFYVLDINIAPAPAGDAFHCEQCHVTLLRRVTLNGGNREAQETLKVNQSQYFYVEDSDIHGANDNAIDFVSVQYGHVVRNRIHNAEDWCIYNKGGSAYLLVQDNEIYNCGTGGYTAGQGTGFEFVSSPWLHYEAYDIKFVNNIIHHTEGAGFGVNGGYNILLAFNTLYRVGSRSQVIEAVYGYRSCDGNTAECTLRNSAGGWGPTLAGAESAPIPNKNVFIYNNIVYNPAPFQSGYQHFAVYGPLTPPSDSNIPSPAHTDNNLQIRGNIIWNGGPSMPLGIEDEDQGCQPSNASCNASQLMRENTVNTLEPQFLDPAQQDFRPVAGGNIFTATTYELPNFGGGDRQATPLAPAGNLVNDLGTDRGGEARVNDTPVAGAYVSASSRLDPNPGTPGSPNPPGPGGNDGGGVQPPPVPTNPPEVSKVKITKKLKARKKITVQATVKDNSKVQRDWGEVVGLAEGALKGKKGKYKGSFRLDVAGVYPVVIHALDDEGNETVALAGYVTVTAKKKK